MQQEKYIKQEKHIKHNKKDEKIIWFFANQQQNKDFITKRKTNQLDSQTTNPKRNEDPIKNQNQNHRSNLTKTRKKMNKIQ